jgi:small conductance mechanosensitive channel
VAVLGQFGVQTTSLIALLGAAGLAVGLALQGTLSNVASGALLLILRPFRVHDRIKVADAFGMAREIGLFRTEIVTDDGAYVSIPNTTIFSGVIVNVSRETMRRTNFTVEVDRGENLDGVQKAILEGLARHPQVLKTPVPTVEVDTLGSISTTLTVHAWIRNENVPMNLSDVKKRVRQVLQDAEVSAPVPVPAPSVAPWTPAAEQSQESQKPN